MQRVSSANRECNGDMWLIMEDSGKGLNNVVWMADGELQMLLERPGTWYAEP